MFTAAVLAETDRRYVRVVVVYAGTFSMSMVIDDMHMQIWATEGPLGLSITGGKINAEINLRADLKHIIKAHGGFVGFR